MDGGQMKFLEQFTLITDIIFGLMILLYLYQIVYIAVSMFKRKVPKLPDAKKNHRYAISVVRDFYSCNLTP